MYALEKTNIRRRLQYLRSGHQRLAHLWWHRPLQRTTTHDAGGKEEIKKNSVSSDLLRTYSCLGNFFLFLFEFHHTRELCARKVLARWLGNGVSRVPCCRSAPHAKHMHYCRVCSILYGNYVLESVCNSTGLLLVAPSEASLAPLSTMLGFCSTTELVT